MFCAREVRISIEAFVAILAILPIVTFEEFDGWPMVRISQASPRHDEDFGARKAE